MCGIIGIVAKSAVNQAIYDGANQNVAYMPNLAGGTTAVENQSGSMYLFNF